MIIASGTKVINDYDTLEAVDTANEAKESASKELVAMEHATIDEETGNIAIFGRDADGNITSEMDLTSRGMELYDSGEQVATFAGNKIELGKNSPDSVIEMCAGFAKIIMDYVSTSSTHRVRLAAERSSGYNEVQIRAFQAGSGNSGYAEVTTTADWWSRVDLLAVKYHEGAMNTAGVQALARDDGTALFLSADRLTFNDGPLFKTATTTTTSRSWPAKGTALGQYNYKPDTIAGYTPIGLIGACTKNANVTVSAYYNGSVVSGYAYNHNTSDVSTYLVLRFLYVADGLI